MIDVKALDRALASVDLSDIAEKQAETERRIAAIDDAVERGRKKAMELSQALNNIKGAQRNGREAANALMEDQDVSTIAATEDSIRAERETIQAGMKTLAADAEQLRHERDNLQQQARGRLSAAVEKLADDMRAEAEECSVRLARIYAETRTLDDATKSSKAIRLGSALDYALNGMAAGRLISRDYLHTSPEIMAVLQKHIEVLRVAGTRIIGRHRSSMM